jgi:phasin family protein
MNGGAEKLFCCSAPFFLPVLYTEPRTPIETLFQDTAMTINTEQFTAANKATVDSLLAVANTALASAERIAALNLDTARSALEDTVTGVQSVIGAKDPQAALAAQSSLAQPAVEKAVAYGRSVYEITTQTQQELAQMVEAQIGSFQKSVAGMVDLAAKSAPAGSEGAVAAMQSAIAAANSAFGNMNAVAKQFADAAQANIAALTKQGR